MKIAQRFASADELIKKYGLDAEEVAASQFLAAKESTEAIDKLEVVVAVVARQTMLKAKRELSESVNDSVR